MTRPFACAVIVLLVGCFRGSDSRATNGVASKVSGKGGGTVVCPSYGTSEVVGALKSEALNEVSGIAASALHKGMVYVHNDSGDVARLFALNSVGDVVATLPVSGAEAIDWEDIALGPCADPTAGPKQQAPVGSCIYVADIGDNLRMRSSYTLYRITEPAKIEDATLKAEVLSFTYPDGAHNAETLLVHPTTGVITIVSKVFFGSSSIYEFPMPLTPGKSMVLKKVGQLAPPMGVAEFTGGDVHPHAMGVLLRTYSNVFYYPMSPGASVVEAITGTGCRMPVAVEKQGEAIGWLRTGAGFLTVSEGVGPTLNQVMRKDP